VTGFDPANFGLPGPFRLYDTTLDRQRIVAVICDAPGVVGVKPDVDVAKLKLLRAVGLLLRLMA